MPVVRLLPESVANQIAAGEVIQRPASVIKELVENSIDAGATQVKVVVRDAGRTLIQVIDNGCGMAEDDARLAFERHATSKISQAADLYSLRTMGFRGEALASIAAVAQVELLTRREEDELGVKIVISASKIEEQEPCACAKGSQFSVKNLFFNLPARRNFLKSDNVEMRHVTSEFLRVALAHPSIGLSLTANGVCVYNLAAGNIKRRVADVAGKALTKDLIPIGVETGIVSITGFIGNANAARKNNSDEFFFANERYMRSPYFHKAVADAYKNIIPADHNPAYYIYLSVPAQTIDVNVHPQKTEIKFESESSIWHILNAAVRDSLGKFGIAPTLDFDEGNTLNIPTFSNNTQINIASIPNMMPGANSVYNPFDHESLSTRPSQPTISHLTSNISAAPASHLASPASAPPVSDAQIIQLNAKYIVVAHPDGLMIIDQHRAHERIQYENLSRQVNIGQLPSQRSMFPEVVAMSAEDVCIIEEMSCELGKVGIEYTYDEQAGQIAIEGVPPYIDASEVRGILESLVYDVVNGEADIRANLQDHIVRVLAAHAAIPYGRKLSAEEMRTLIDQLFQTQSPALSPSGKPTYNIIAPNF